MSTSIKTPQIVGILNVTPDSFSDGGQAYQADRALTHAQKLIQAGAVIIDIGAESTRPNATPLTSDQEWARLEPILEALLILCCKHSVKVSVDTYHPQTMARVLELGVPIINDVSGGRSDKIWELAAEYRCQLFLMHSITVPAQTDPDLKEDPIRLLTDWCFQLSSKANKFGVPKSQIVVDPGIGFGKSAVQSWQLLRESAALKNLGFQVLIGHSRKSFLSTITTSTAKERDLHTHLISFFLAQQQISYLRVHDVAGTKETLDIYRTLFS